MAMAFTALPLEHGIAMETSGSGRLERAALSAAAGDAEEIAKRLFPVTTQVSPLPGGAAWKGATPPQAKAALRATIDAIVDHGITGLEYPFHLSSELDQYVLDYARSRGMYITYNRTFAKGGVEIFGRNAAPRIPVYAPEYEPAVRKNLEPVLAEARQLPGIYNLFCYQDEPFHAGPESFDWSLSAQQQFQKQFGYEMPLDLEKARKSPEKWLDLINFQSREFPAGWRQAYKIIKESNPSLNVILTNDSHSVFGAGVDSNSKLAVDDVFYWGADFADTFVFDIYPYMMFDFRYGEFGKFRKPRLSQMHFAFAQLRDLTYTYKKGMGFWFGTYNRRWFKDFMGPELRAEDWAEAETTYTAVGQGADFLISGYNIPEDKEHWDVLGKGLNVLQKAGQDLIQCPKAKARACFLFPRTQYIQMQQEYWNVAVAYESFLRAFGELDCLHEEQVKDAGLDGYEILVLFDVQMLPKEVAERIAAFVEAGGTVIADCAPCFDADRRRTDAMEKLFGVEDASATQVKRSGVWKPDLFQPHWFIHPAPGDAEDEVVGEIVEGVALGGSFYFRVISPRSCKVTSGEVLLKGVAGAPALVRKKTGKGQTFLLGFCMQDTYYETWKSQDLASRADLERLLWAATQSAGVSPRIRSSNPDIEACLRMNATSAYVLAINHEASDAKTHIEVSDPGFDVARILNLTEDREVKFHRVRQGVAFDAEAPRRKPQLLHLLAASGKRAGV